MGGGGERIGDGLGDEKIIRDLEIRGATMSIQAKIDGGFDSVIIISLLIPDPLPQILLEHAYIVKL